MATVEEDIEIKLKERNKKFFDKDLPHSKIKRKILRYNLKCFFELHLTDEKLQKELLPVKRENENGQNGDAKSDSDFLYLAYYFDPFCGRGMFRSEGENEPEELDVDATTKEVADKFGSPVIAIDTCLWQIRKMDLELNEREILYRYDDCKRQKMEDTVVRCVRFFFGDIEKSHIRKLKSVLISWMTESKHELRRWSVHHRKTITPTCEQITFRRKSDKISGIVYQIKISFQSSAFSKWNLKKLRSPLFSFIDPFDIKDAEVLKMSKLVGKDKSLLLYFMVSKLNRRDPDKWGHMLDRVYHDSSWRQAYGDVSTEKCPYIAPSDHLTLRTNQKLEKLKDAYCQTLKFYVGLQQIQLGCGNTPPTRTAAFAIRNRGKTTPDKATLSYIIFAAQSLFLLDKAKYSFQHVSSPRPSQMGAPERNDLAERSRESLYFSNYFHFQGIDVKLGRQFTFEEEADVIHAKFTGNSDVRLGEVRRFVLEETGFPYHTTALKILEEQGRMSVKTGGWERRQRGMFPQRVPDDHLGTEGGNHWKLCFS